MAKTLIGIRRNLSEYRVAAYECTVVGSTVRKGKRVAGWYGMFDEQRLKQEIGPKLAEYATQKVPFPFLVTSYMLEGGTEVSVETSGNRGNAGDVKFRPRRRRTAHQNEAIVHSATRYELLR